MQNNVLLRQAPPARDNFAWIVGVLLNLPAVEIVPSYAMVSLKLAHGKQVISFQ